MFQVQEKDMLNEEILNDDDLTSLFVRKLHRIIFLISRRKVGEILIQSPHIIN